MTFGNKRTKHDSISKPGMSKSGHMVVIYVNFCILFNFVFAENSLQIYRQKMELKPIDSSHKDFSWGFSPVF